MMHFNRNNEMASRNVLCFRFYHREDAVDILHACSFISTWENTCCAEFIKREQGGIEKLPSSSSFISFGASKMFFWL